LFLIACNVDAPSAAVLSGRSIFVRMFYPPAAGLGHSTRVNVKQTKQQQAAAAAARQSI